MGWFEKQIEKRREADLDLLQDSFARAAGVVMGEKYAEKLKDDKIIAKNAIDHVLKYYHYKSVDVPYNVKGFDNQLDYCLRPYGIMYRTVELDNNWYKNTYGPLIGFLKKDNTPVAFIPSKFGTYYYNDPSTGNRAAVSGSSTGIFTRTAYCFYRPLPLKKIGVKDLIIYIKNCLSVSDVVSFLIATTVVTLVSMIMPKITRLLTGPVFNSGNKSILIGVAIFAFCAIISSSMLTIVKGLLMSRLNIKTSMGVQASMMMRLMSLPPSFFRQYSPGELSSRSQSVDQLCSIITNMLLSSGLTSLVSLAYIAQIFGFAKVLVIPSLLIILVTVVFSAVSSLVQIGINRKRMELAAKESGMSYAAISGVQKIKLAGAESRMFSKWLDIYSEEAKYSYNPPMFIKMNSVITVAIGLVSNIVIYTVAAKGHVTQADYFGFNAAYGSLMGAFTALASIALTVAQIKPIIEMAKPFMDAEPETAEGKEIVTSITGGIELNHVSFRYADDLPDVIEDLSLKINPGDYIAVVGKTGCGKSTLIRLLLGFEKPQKGSIYYGGKDLESLDKASLRKKIGTVMQDAGLFQGDIYSNITITAPELPLEAAWEAAEKAGIAEDIREMPMGMFTLISEGQGGISGGQKQRIMIARAIAPKPKLLLFDEATSALDNKTQKQVSDSLDNMGCTRIVVAHRLSTIRHCDRIIVLDGGHIIEDGTYDELIARKGFFAELVERQRLDAGNN